MRKCLYVMLAVSGLALWTSAVVALWVAVRGMVGT